MHNDSGGSYWKGLEGSGSSVSAPVVSDVPQIISEVTSSPFYTSTVITDVGICVGMRNVNLNCDNSVCLYPQSTRQTVTKIPNCCNFAVFNKITSSSDQREQIKSDVPKRRTYAKSEVSQEILAASQVDRQCSSATFAGVKVIHRENSEISWLYAQHGHVGGSKDDLTIGKTMSMTRATIFKNGHKNQWMRHSAAESPIKIAHVQRHNTLTAIKMVKPVRSTAPKKKWIQHYFRGCY